MSKTKKGLFVALSMVAFALVLLGVFFVKFIISYPMLSSEVIASSDFEEFSKLSLDPLITFIPEELRGTGNTSPTYVATDPTLGNKEAKVKLVIFSDMVSEASYILTPDIMEVAERNPAAVELTWKDFPIPRMYGSSLIAAQAARCAQVQDQASFWQMRELIVQNRESISQEKLTELAVSLGLDKDKFALCLEANSTLALVQRNYLEAKFLGLDIPPILYINGERYMGVYSYNDILKYINQII